MTRSNMTLFVIAMVTLLGISVWILVSKKEPVLVAQTNTWPTQTAAPAPSVRPLAPEPPPHPQAPKGAWNDRPGPRTPIEQAFQDSGSWLVVRSGPGLPGWWYGPGLPKGECIIGSLFTRTDAAGMYLCGPSGWRHVETTPCVGCSR